MPTLTTWAADRMGFFQGTATPGQVAGRFIDWPLANITKFPYSGAYEPRAEARAMMGTHVSTRTARHGTGAYLLGNVLVATRESWEGSLKETS